MSETTQSDSRSFVPDSNNLTIWDDSYTINFRRPSSPSRHTRLGIKKSYDSLVKLYVGNIQNDKSNSQKNRFNVFKVVIEKELVNTKFENQLSKFDKYFDDYDKIKISNCFHANIDWIMNLEFGKINISLTESPSLFFQLSDKNKSELSLEVFVESDNVAYSLYYENALVRQDIGTSQSTYKELLKEFEFDYGNVSRTKASNLENEDELLQLF